MGNHDDAKAGGAESKPVDAGRSGARPLPSLSSLPAPAPASGPIPVPPPVPPPARVVRSDAAIPPPPRTIT
ncbi:MAG TPA: hypothetical protein VHE35_16905, partial [Kofleriaceae bacterium]|nr:hypothetical protein [Kofleriaceae bacterium]